MDKKLNIAFAQMTSKRDTKTVPDVYTATALDAVSGWMGKEEIKLILQMG